MFVYPQINPVAFSLGPLKVHWYGLMYLLGFLFGFLLIKHRVRKFNLGWSNDQLVDLLFYAAIGVVLGGRIGYVLFYNLPYYLHHPLQVFAIWDGGMSFHGGMLGVTLAILLWSFKHKRAFFTVTDTVAPVVPIGLATGRVGNFINGELWGRVTHVPWAMIYPQAGSLPRHPSEVYEFLLEGVLLFIILWIYSARRPPRMAVTGVFLIGYGSFRFLCEFFRQPDPQLGFVAFGWVTMGQVLSLPMILLGVFLFILAYRCKRTKAQGEEL